MARLKFLVFALVALGLWAYHLTLIAPLALAGSVEQAQAAVAGAAGPIAVGLESRRSLTQAVALKVGGGAAAWCSIRAQRIDHGMQAVTQPNRFVITHETTLPPDAPFHVAAVKINRPVDQWLV